MSAFADLHRGPEPLLLPGAWDVASALLLAGAGCAAVGTTSLGVTAAAGLPDGAGEGRDLTVALAARLAPRLPVPLSVDLEGGYSEDPQQVAALAAELAALGVVGVNLEDGLPGGALRDVHRHAAVVAAVRTAAPGLFVNARTDTWWSSSLGPAQRRRQTLERVRAYRDAGASGVFTPGLVDLRLVEEVAHAAALPLNVLWQPGVGLGVLAAAGVARVSTGSALYRYAAAGALDALRCARTGTPPPGPAVPYDALQRLLA